MTDPIAVLTTLLASVAASDWLGKRGPGKSLGAAVIVIALGAILGNSGIVPSASTSPPLYDGIFKIAGPLSIFLLLLDVRLGELRRAGGPMLTAFFLGAAGTTLGAFLAAWITRLPALLGAKAGPLSGMFAATYVGGSTNFNAIALHYGLVKDGIVFAGATAVDATIGTSFILVILSMPRMLYRLGLAVPRMSGTPSAVAEIPDEPKAVSAGELSLTLSVALGALYASQQLEETTNSLGVQIPAILALTTIALVIAQLPWIRRLSSARRLGQLAVLLFLGVIGVHCELATVQKLGELAPTLIFFVCIVLVVHSIVLVGGGLLLRLEPEIICLGSNANVMGATTAPAVAVSVGRHDLVLPGVLAGALGNALGTYLGFAVASLV
jgi:uncharacterized membrane protein